MSVQATAWVIENSKQKGSAFVLLLMIANHAHSDGTGSYAGVETLARESRITPRHVIRLLPRLEKSGELKIAAGASPHGGNLYSLPKMPKRTPDKLSYDKMSPPDKLSADKCSTGDNLSRDKCGPQMSPESKLIKREPKEEPKFKTLCAQASFAAPRLEPEFSLVLNTGEFHPVFKSDIERYKALYPAVDVEQSFRSMIGWLDADPKRRKTKNGIARFINGWLSREQDRGRRKRGNGESYGERRTRENAANLGLAGPAVPTRVL